MRRFVVVIAVGAFLAVAGCSSTSDTMSADDQGSDAVRSQSTDAPTEPTDEVADEPTEDPTIEIVEQGFANLPASSEFDDPDGTAAAIVRNPSTDKIAESVEIQLTLLDAAGTVLKNQDSTISALLPGASAAVSVTEPGLTGVAEVQVQARASRWEDAEGELGSMTVSGLNIRPQEYGGADINGVVSSTVGQDLEDVEVQVVFRDASGAPVAGTWTYVDFIPAAGESAFTISTFNDIPPDWTVEGFAIPSFMTLMSGS